MSLRRFLNRPGWRGRTWQIIYAGGYACLKGAVSLVTAPFFRVRIVGRRRALPAGGVLVCANHASYMDPVFVQLRLSRRVTFMMTNDFYKNPLGRWFFALVGAIPVGSPRLARAGMRRAEALLRRGRVVVIFPEGRLSRDGQMGRAQRGIAILARRANVPIVPVGICGSFRAWSHGRTSPRRAYVRLRLARALRHPGGTSREADQAFADQVMRRIARTCDTVRARVPSDWDVAPPTTH